MKTIKILLRTYYEPGCGYGLRSSVTFEPGEVVSMETVIAESWIRAGHAEAVAEVAAGVAADSKAAKRKR